MVYFHLMKEVTCNNCREVHYRLTRDIQEGEYLKADQFERVDGGEVVTKGDVVICPNCNSSSGIGRGVEVATGFRISS